MAKKRLSLFSTIVVVSFLIAPILFLQMMNQISPITTGLSWSATYRWLLFGFAILVISYPYLIGRKIASAAIAKKSNFGSMAPDQLLLGIGLCCSLAPITAGFLLAIYGFAISMSELYILTVISYVAMIVWVVRWHFAGANVV